jgi:hypothetical protein
MHLFFVSRVFGSGCCWLSKEVSLCVFVNTVAAEIIAADASAEFETKSIRNEAPAFVGVKRGNLDLLFEVDMFRRPALLQKPSWN